MSAILDRDAAAFEAHRRALIGLAYRMLGSRAEAEDVVQDAYLRWHAADRAGIGEARRFLGKVVTRLCLDRMKSARRGASSTSANGCRSRSSTKSSKTSTRVSWRTTFPLR